MYWSFTGVGDSAEVLSRDIQSMHWARADIHWDGAGLEKGCDVSFMKQHLCLSGKCISHFLFLVTGGTIPLKK